MAKKITTVEGNKGNKVSKCSYTLGGKNNILGFLRPRYDDEATAEKTIKWHQREREQS